MATFPNLHRFPLTMLLHEVTVRTQSQRMSVSV